MAAPIRVLSIPAGHVYVQHLAHPDVPGVSRLDDPPVSPTAPAAQWWPPPALDGRWLRRHAGDFDLVHLHFGFDGQSPDQLREMTGTLAELGKPFVYTVHDLRNPHHDTHTLHDEQLDVLVPAADRLITLTPGAAKEIQDRWDRDVLVLPHPHVVDEPTLSAPRHPRDEFVVGIHLKSLRASMDPGVVSAVGDVIADLPGARLQVNVHCDVVDPELPNHDPEVTALLADGVRRQQLSVRVHDFLPDEELWRYLCSLDVSVLPYRFGTHSGWLEACHDLGTAVLAPDSGYYAEQRPCLMYHRDEVAADVGSLDDALRRAYNERPEWRAAPEDRRLERRMLAHVHRDLYEEVLA
jgi:glycosyltransferase involved in cell wall biosynthesis